MDNSSEPTPVAATMGRMSSPKPRRRFAPDPRLFIGLALVVASVVGTVGLILALDDTVEVYAASDALTPGERLEAAQLEVVAVRLDAASARYLTPGDLTESFVVTRTVGAGELVPRAAVAAQELSGTTSLVLSVGGAVARAIEPGTTVDVWAAREDETGRFAPPTVLVDGAVVVALVEEGSIVTRGEVTAIEVRVPSGRVATVLEAIANDDALSIVPTAVG